MRFPLVAALALCISIFASGEASSYTSGSGHDYDMTCNQNGYVLHSTSPVSRWVFGEVGSNTYTVRQTEVIYLGRSCDAQTEIMGAGEWCWANGGFVVEFDGGRLTFPRQELLCLEYENLGDDCLC
ncbi:hypothetical protein [uncultured Aliiroseovarius sp.]|uniref:hypothetical protein n=1 Tax=uncultured Aliiroseovarius sp. TaxID=1658783 RepID=UPI002605D709|nr:hypothetical protein [uncultured Aliiroseovarius sp.]